MSLDSTKLWTERKSQASKKLIDVMLSRRNVICKVGINSDCGPPKGKAMKTGVEKERETENERRVCMRPTTMAEQKRESVSFPFCEHHYLHCVFCRLCAFARIVGEIQFKLFALAYASEA